MIAPMKKVTVFALRKDRGAVLLEMQRNGIFMPLEPEDCVRDGRLSQTELSLQSAADSLLFLKSFREKPGFFQDPPQLNYADFIAEKDAEQHLSDEVHTLRDKLSRIESDLSSVSAAMRLLEPWLPLEIPLSDLRSTRSSTVITGFIPLRSAEKLMSTQQDHPVFIQLLHAAAGSCAVFIVSHNTFSDELTDILKTLGFVSAAAPSAQGTARQELDRLLLQQSALKAEQDAVKMRAAQIGSSVQSIEVLYDHLRSDVDRRRVPFLRTDAVFYVQGWVEASRTQELQTLLQQVTSQFDIAFEDPAKGEKVPTITRNAPLVTPFESITDMFSRPTSLEGVDPNTVMAPWYWLLFGMMMADLGYGISIVLLFWLFKKIKKPRGNFNKIITVLMYGGFTTALWGVLFGSCFGESFFPPLLGFTPLGDPLTTLIVCFGMGVLHLFFGFCVAAYYRFKAGDILGGIADNICWMLILSSLGLLLVPSLKTIALVILFPALLFKLFFSRNDTKNPLKRFFSGLSSLVGITNHVSDIISYSRIMALILSGGVTGMVMNLMGSMLWGAWYSIPFAIVVYAFGHIFNLSMSMLSAYVHTSRLQYIEFFGKFYEGGGYEFRPLSVESKYTVVQNKKSA